MCNGNQTEMACGHVLTHYSQRCEKGRPKPCSELKLDTPRQHLVDSCAQCDPEFRKSKLSRDQKNRHDELVTQLIEDKRVNESKEARRLLECMQKLRLTMNHKIGEVKTAGFSEDVEFPGSSKHSMAPRTTSKWINGKCVWSDEDLQRARSLRNREMAPSRTSTTEAFVESAESTPLGPPRLRATKKEYFNRLPEEIEQSPISGPPRLRTNKSYSGPRENVVIFEESEEQQALRPKPSLRRTRKVASGLKRSKFPGAESDITVKSTRPNVHITLNAEPESDEDMWLLLAERPRPPISIGSGSVCSFRDRMLK
ncbi:hypothetical protein F5B19DRAFT_272358 [Rostrohypoxylon terebratum]|nr:hypothetical protein F5B19DRAFT_272358 [Rostrohypoxylon terebratum]